MKLTLLPVDSAFAFDYYSILQVKQANGLPVGNEMSRVGTILEVQHRNLSKILASNEYRALYAVNRSIFNAVDAAWKDEVSASRVQKLNQKRHKAKQALQKKFWPKDNLMELKSN